MALNRDRIGTTYPPYRYEVSREKIREYAAALGETDPRYFSDADDCVAPPTFAACFTVVKGSQPLMADPGLGTHPALVHGSQRYRFGDRPLRPGDVLTCTPKVADISARGGSEFLSIEVDCRFDSGELAVLSEATLVFFGSASPVGSSAEVEPRADAAGDQTDDADSADEDAAAASARTQEGAA